MSKTAKDAEATLRGAYWALREEGVGPIAALFHAPIFYVVAYRQIHEVADRLEDSQIPDPYEVQDQ